MLQHAGEAFVITGILSCWETYAKAQKVEGFRESVVWRFTVRNGRVCRLVFGLGGNVREDEKLESHQ